MVLLMILNFSVTWSTIQFGDTTQDLGSRPRSTTSEGSTILWKSSNSMAAAWLDFVLSSSVSKVVNSEQCIHFRANGVLIL